MFAGSIHSIVCHLVESNATATVCGLRVSMFVSSRPSGSRLHFLTSRPLECRVCKHCIRIGSIPEPDLVADTLDDIVPLTI